MNINELLENRHVWFLEWGEPWQACGPEGNRLDAHVALRATIHDCINLQRRSDLFSGPLADEPYILARTDAELLEEFMAVYWAEVVKPEKQAKEGQP